MMSEAAEVSGRWSAAVGAPEAKSIDFEAMKASGD